VCRIGYNILLDNSMVNNVTAYTIRYYHSYNYYYYY